MRQRVLVSAVLVAMFAAPAVAQSQAIVAEQRARYGTPIGDANIVPLLREIASALNAAQVPGGPFGILVKTSGNNCGGYSCDIVCSGQGDQQRQWDVIVGNDEQSPTWHEVDNPTVRPCEMVPASQPQPDPTPQPQPTPQQPQPGLDIGPLLLKIVALLEEIRDGQVAERAAQDAQTAALKTAIAELQAQVARGVRIRF